MMKKSVALIVTLLAAALIAKAQTPGDWVKFAPPEGRVSVLMPVQPQDEKKLADKPREGVSSITLFMAHAENEGYAVGWMDYDFDPKFNFSIQKELDSFRDTLVKRFNARLLKTTGIKLGEHPGIEFLTELDGRYAVHSRAYFVGSRLYGLVAIIPAGRDGTQSLKRFFSSFSPLPPK
jgi:hypothetical protein